MSRWILNIAKWPKDNNWITFEEFAEDLYVSTNFKSLNFLSLTSARTFMHQAGH